jgi:protein TonB
MGVSPANTFNDPYCRALLALLLATASWCATGAPNEPTNPPISPPLNDASKTHPPALILHAFPPSYPREWAEAGDVGLVVVVVRVSAAGAVSVELEKSSRSRRLDELALATISRWTFRPSLVDGQPADSAVRIPMEFSPR